MILAHKFRTALPSFYADTSWVICTWLKINELEKRLWVNTDVINWIDELMFT
jgi:hypothetical protein